MMTTKEERMALKAQKIYTKLMEILNKYGK